jgi:pre-mRNA-processing factor 6
MTDLVEIGNARDKVLSLKLDQVSFVFLSQHIGILQAIDLVYLLLQASQGSVTPGSSSTIDPKGYLTDLNSMVVQSDAQIG